MSYSEITNRMRNIRALTLHFISTFDYILCYLTVQAHLTLMSVLALHVSCVLYVIHFQVRSHNVLTLVLMLYISDILYVIPLGSRSNLTGHVLEAGIYLYFLLFYSSHSWVIVFMFGCRYANGAVVNFPSVIVCYTHVIIHTLCWSYALYYTIYCESRVKH